MFDSFKSARKTDPATSQVAAITAAEFAGSHCERIVAALRQCGPMDPEQIAAMLDMEPYSVRKRLSDLQRQDLAAPTGVIVPTRAGRSQRVWGAV